MIHEDPDDIGYFTDTLASWGKKWEDYLAGRQPLEPFDPAPPSDQSATIHGVDCSQEEQRNIQAAAERQHYGRQVAAEMSRERAGYAKLFNSSGNIV